MHRACTCVAANHDPDADDRYSENRDRDRGGVHKSRRWTVQDVSACDPALEQAGAAVRLLARLHCRYQRVCDARDAGWQTSAGHGRVYRAATACGTELRGQLNRGCYPDGYRRAIDDHCPAFLEATAYSNMNLLLKV